MLMTLMGAGAVTGHHKETSNNQQDTLSSTRSNSHSRFQSESNATTSAGSEASPSVVKASVVTITNSLPKSGSRNQGSTMKMSCEMCSTNFTLFKRKKFCQECHRYFCSTCLPKPSSSSSSLSSATRFQQSGRQCSKCKLLMSGQFSRTDLQDWKVKDIRCFLNVRKISTISCKEKHDLIELALARFSTKRRYSLQDQAEHDILVRHMAARLQNDDCLDPPSHADLLSSSASSSAGVPHQSHPPPDSHSKPNEPNFRATSHGNESRATQQPDQDDNDPDFLSGQWQALFDSMEAIQEMFTRHGVNPNENHPSQASDGPKPPPPAQESSPQRQRCHLDDVQFEEEMERLTVKQLKELLVNNFVDYKGCCEKPELVERVKRLWRDHQINKAKAERIHLADEAEAAGRSASSSSSSPHPPHITETNATKSNGAQEEDDSGIRVSTADDPTPSSGHSVEAAHQDPVASSIPQHPQEPGGDDSLCRVCMDALSDCILLECGHMVTCTTCGKQLAECPICRQYIARVVRVFRS